MTGAVESLGVVAERYRVDRVIGRGAMGEVLEVFDSNTGRKLALKRPRAVPESVVRAGRVSLPINPTHFASVLRHEYLILSQLAHPNVVAVYDLGGDAGMPYYTMALLQGRHPGSQGTLQWHDVCRMLVTLCEPLALLHARRLVHRDLSPRNVFVAEDGSATLIDFGAMASMDAHHRPIGTPSCMAPEVWRREHLDGRADVYGLGSLAYCALTGRHAYPGRGLAQLPIVWQTMPAPPSDLVPDIPRALDELVLSMLSLDRDSRPTSVAEVVQHVRTIADLEIDSSWVAPPEALATPALVGRDRQLGLVDGFIERAHETRGLACVVRGRAGSGRTRLLDALSQRAETAGMTVVRASAGTLEPVAFTLMRELTQALRVIVAEPSGPPLPPEIAQALAALEGDAAIGALDEAGSVALQSSFLALCEHEAASKPLCFAIDDIERADAMSIRVLAQLARRASDHAFLLAFVAGEDRPDSGHPLAALLRHSAYVETNPLDAAESEAMLQSIFGDVPNLERVASWVYRHALGEPDAIITLCEYLVRSGAARFSAGSWELQGDIEALRLPTEAEGKLELALPSGTEGRHLLELLSLVTRPFPLELSAYVTALPEGQATTALDALVRAQRLLATTQGYVMRDYASLAWARDRIDPARAAELHRALARVYVEYGPEHALQVAYHTWLAGDREAADDGVRKLAESAAYGLRNLVWRAQGLAVPATFLEELLAYRKAQRASPADLYVLRGTLLAVALMSDVGMSRYGPETLAQLRLDVGLDFWEATDAALSPVERVRACVAKASARTQAMPDAERGLPPDRALIELVRCIGLLGSPASFTQDVALIQILSELMAPLADLSPTSRLIADTTQISHDSIVLGDRCWDRRRALIAASTPEAGANVDPITRSAVHYLTKYYFSLELGADGRAEAVAIADELERHPAHEVLALQARRIHALGCGRYEDAQRFRRRRELLALRTERDDNQLRFALLRELQAGFQCSDMLEMSRAAPRIEELAAEYPGWQPWVTLARAMIHLRADEPASAVETIEAQLATLAPFGHSAWHNLSVALAEAKNDLREYPRAREIVQTTREGAAGLGITLDTEPRLRAALAHAEAGLGDPKGAGQSIAGLIAELEREVEPSSVLLGMIRESACHIALLAKDYNEFSRQLDLLGAQYANHPGLRARHARFVRKGKERFRKLLAVLEKANAAKDWSVQLANQLAERSADDGSDYLLSFVLDELRIDAGQLYRITADRQIIRLAARPDTDEVQLQAAAEQTATRFLSYDEVQTEDERSETAILQDSQGRSYIPLWLMRPERSDQLLGLLLLNCSPERLAKLTPSFVKAVAMHLGALA